MFFTLSPNPDQRLPNHDKFGSYWFSHDDGWGKNTNFWYKGYNHALINHGNFLKLILISDNEILLEHDTVRGFPLWWDNQSQTLTNLLGKGLQIWNDKTVSIKDHCLIDKDRDSYLLLESKKISFEYAVDLICANLIKKTQSLKIYENNAPKKIFLTGGVDTITIYSVLKYVGVEVELVDYEYVKYDWFLNKNLSNIKEKHWGYGQIHHWNQPTLLITGACGDEFLMRGPRTISLWTAANNINIVELLKTNVNNYHVSHFLKQKNVDMFNDCWSNRLKIKEKYKGSNSLNNHLINIISNDCQHWHIGNTITWTPFKDLELLKICLSLDTNDLINHILDASLNRAIIKKVYPKALSLISNQKNINPRENLVNLS